MDLDRCSFVLASATLAAGAAVAETADLFTDLSLSATATTSASLEVFENEGGPDAGFDVPDDIVEQDSATIEDFASLPATSSLRPGPISRDGERGVVGEADALIDLERTADAVRFSTEVTASGFQRSDFGTFLFFEGEIRANAAFDYDFRLERPADFVLAVGDRDFSVGSRNRSTPFSAVLRDLATDEIIGSILESGHNQPADPFRDAGSLAAGDYRLTFGAFVSGSFRGGEFATADASLTFTEASAVVPSPAALPAGLALLGGVLGRRRR